MWKPLKFHQTTNQRSSFDSIASVRIIRLLSPFFLLYARRERIFHFHFNKSCWNIEQISLVVCSSHAICCPEHHRLSAYISYKCKVSSCSWLCWWERKYLLRRVFRWRAYIFSLISQIHAYTFEVRKKYHSQRRVEIYDEDSWKEKVQQERQRQPERESVQ